MRKASARVVSLLALIATPFAASAHAFGQQFTLALPVSFFIFGGVAAFIASNCVILFFSEPKTHHAVSSARVTPIQASAALWKVGAWIGVIGFLLELAFAFFGLPDFVGNPAVVLFWVWLLLGLTYLSVFFGGVWDFVNPFRTIARFFSKKPLYAYPAWLEYWPAFILFFLVIQFELYSGGGSADPRVLGSRLVLYAIVACIGNALYGSAAWFKYADFFSVFFRMFGMFAPFQLTEQGIERTLPGQKLIDEHPTRLSLLVFILFMLSSTAFDGIKETLPWRGILDQVSRLGLAGYLNLFGIAVLFLSPFIFLGFYALAIGLMRYLTGTKKSFTCLLFRFGYSLIPIAAVYNFAHYFTLLIGEGQRIIYQLSDPFGLKWNLFGTANFHINQVPLGSNLVWYIEVFVIVAGHVVAAVVAHRIAVREFDRPKKIVASQISLLILMVGYTALGLWILSRPFVPG